MTGDQFEVFQNTGRNSRQIPLILVVQCNRFKEAARRLVLPLVAADLLGSAGDSIAPSFTINGVRVVADPLQLTSVPRSQLGQPVASLAAHSDQITAALDAVLSPAWR